MSVCGKGEVGGGGEGGGKGGGGGGGGDGVSVQSKCHQC